MIQYFKKQWQVFKAKSAWAKTTDILLLLLLIAVFTPDGRVMMQRMILKTGIMGSIEKNMDEAVAEASKTWLLQDMKGNTLAFSSFEGKPVFLNFWATWCPPCKAEMPSILELKQEMGDKVELVLVSYEDPEKVRVFLADNAWDLPVYFPLTEIPSQLKASALPSTFIIDSKFRIVHRSKGMSDWASQEVKSLLLML